MRQILRHGVAEGFHLPASQRQMKKINSSVISASQVSETNRRWMFSLLESDKRINKRNLFYAPISIYSSCCKLDQGMIELMISIRAFISWKFPHWNVILSAKIMPVAPYKGFVLYSQRVNSKVARDQNQNIGYPGCYIGKRNANLKHFVRHEGPCAECQLHIRKYSGSRFTVHGWQCVFHIFWDSWPARSCLNFHLFLQLYSKHPY